MVKRRFLLYLIIAVVIFILLVWYFSNIFFYILISLVLTTILKPLTNTISQFQVFNVKIPRVLAVLFSYSVLLLILSLFIVLFIPLISEQIQVLKNTDYERLYFQLTSPLEKLERFMIENRLTIEKQPGFIIENLRLSILGFLKKITFGEVVNNIIAFTGNFFIGLLAVIFITFFLLYEKGIIRKQFLAIVPNQYFELYIAAVTKLETLLSNYLLGLLLQMFCIFSLASLGLSIFGIKYAITIAVFAAIANLIPYAGPIMGSLFGMLVGILTADYNSNSDQMIFLIIKIAGVFSIVKLIDDLVLQPFIFSKSVKAHPLEIFITIFVGATIAGIFGMVLAIPAYTLLRVSFIEIYKGYKEYQIFKN